MTSAVSLVDVPEGFDSMLWRLVLSPRIGASLIEIERDWTMGDVLAAHLALDVSEDIEAAISESLSEAR